jgi:hypothetical protein
MLRRGKTKDRTIAGDSCLGGYSMYRNSRRPHRAQGQGLSQNSCWHCQEGVWIQVQAPEAPPGLTRRRSNISGPNGYGVPHHLSAFPIGSTAVRIPAVPGSEAIIQDSFDPRTTTPGGNVFSQVTVNANLTDGRVRQPPKGNSWRA